MKELYAAKRRENRFRFGWVLLFFCALVWLIEGGVWPFVAGALAICFAAIERAKAYASGPSPKMYTKENGLEFFGDWYKKLRISASFGESVRDTKFSVTEYFWRVYVGMIPAILLCMVLYGAVAWRILLPWKMIILSIAAFDVIPVVALLLYALSVSTSLKSGRSGRSFPELASRVISRCGSIVMLSVMAFRASDWEVSTNLREAIGWINVREKSVIALESNFDWTVSDLKWIAWVLMILAAVLYFAKKIQCIGVVLYLVLLLVMISPLKLRNYVTLSEDRLYVNEGFFDFCGTEIDFAKDVASYRVFLAGNAQFEYPGIGFDFVLKDGTTMQFEWYDFQTFPLFWYRPTQFCWDLDPGDEIDRRFDISFGFAYATDKWAEEYDNCSDFAWDLVEKFSSLGIKGELVPPNVSVEKMLPSQQEVLEKLKAKLPLAE
ncbi:MAG: hypothetical protein J5645_02970 [Lachnospiraceae bacterium]|nr:hypothetical protein [Lachnospiraceae bacterium]